MRFKPAFFCVLWFNFVIFRFTFSFPLLAQILEYEYLSQIFLAYPNALTLPRWVLDSCQIILPLEQTQIYSLSMFSSDYKTQHYIN